MVAGDYRRDLLKVPSSVRDYTVDFLFARAGNRVPFVSIRAEVDRVVETLPGE